MIPFVLVLLVAAAPTPITEGKLVWSLPAGMALAHGDSIALWSPDFRSVLGLDAKGKRVWRVATGDQGGYRTLEQLGPNVLAYAGTEAVLIEPKSGKVLGRQPHVVLGSPGKPGCHIDMHAGACGLACPCSFLPLRCEDLHPVAARASIPMFEEWDQDGHRESQCMGSAGRIVGKSGGVIVVELPRGDADPQQFALSTELVGLDADTAQARWRSRALIDGLSFDDDLSGALADGKTCYVGTRPGALRVFDCQRAVELWRKQLVVPKGAEPQIEAAGDGLVVRDGPQVKRLGADGHVAWQVEVPANELFVLSSDHEPRQRRFAKLAAAVVLDPTTGARRARVPFVAKQTHWPVPFAGGWLAQGDEGYVIDGVTVDTKAFIEELMAGTTLLARRTHDGIRVDALAKDGRHDVRVEGDRLIAIEGALGVGRVLVLKDGVGRWDPKDPKTFGELRLLDLTAALARSGP